MTNLNSLIKVAMVATGIAAFAAQARAVNVSYVDVDGTTKQADATVVAASDSRVTWQAGWYVVTNEVEVKGGADCSGAVHLILADTGKLTMTNAVAKNNAGIGVSGDGNSFAIYGQTLGTGALTVTGGTSGAGIGGGVGGAGSNITIDGGTVTATGGSDGAGIGGGREAAGSNITINGGEVTATGGQNGAGIGGGMNRAGSNITINGGKVTATGGDRGAGIGGGREADGSAITINGGEVTANGSNKAAGIGGGGSGGAGSNIKINGGSVTATGGDSGAGIGGGCEADGSAITINGGEVTATGGQNGAGIGGGRNAAGSNITINGGEVTATGGKNGAGIGGGSGVGGAGSNITIDDGTVKATGLDGGAGIGGGSQDSGSDITINGGVVTAKGGGGGAGIGGGIGGAGSNITIDGGTVTANGGMSGGAGIGSGYSGGAASNIFAADDVIVKAGASVNPTMVIAHLGAQDIADDLAGKRCVTAVLPPPAEVTVADVTGATAKVYTNKTEITERPAVIEYGTAFDVVYTADEGKMFPGGYKTFETNLTANAAAITVALTADQQPVAAKACADCLTFSGDAAFGIRMRKEGTPAEPKLEYSTDQIYWSKFDLENGAAAGADNKLYLRGTGNTQFATDFNEYYVFTNTTDSAAAAIACSGNIMTLLDYRTVAKGEEPTMGECGFAKLFRGFAALTTAPALPATNLEGGCYGCMFSGCTALTAAPALPATNLTVDCYDRMFSGCTALTAAPALPATNLAELCYVNMFDGCTALTTAHALPATKLAKECYKNMFQGCAALTAAPALPATTLTESCYLGMFNGCTSLTDVPTLPATNLANTCYGVMFKGCASLEVNTNGTGKAWSIPSDAAASVATASQWNAGMFKGTAGDITNTTVTPGVTYYVKSAIKLVTVTVPEVEGATAELFTFYVNGGWKAVEADKVPSNSTVRVLWTADEGKGLTGAGAASAFQWQAELVADKAVQEAPKPTVGEAGASEVTVDIDTRAKKSYFNAADILPVWAAQSAEVKVKGEGEQSWETLVKSSATTNTLTWKPTTPDTYTLSQTAFENATIIFSLPVEVTTNDLAVAGATVKVTDDGGQPLVAQTEGEFAGKLIVPSNSTVTVTWTAAGAGVYFMDGSTTYTQTFAADKSVNPVSEVVTKPEEPKAPSVKLGVVAQRYPWDGKLDVNYWAKNTPNGEYMLKVTVTLPDGTSKSQESDALNGKNTATFGAKEAFGEVSFGKGVKVKAELVEQAPPR